MATATLNPALTAVRGRVGDIVFKTYRARGGNKIVLSRVPRFEGYVPSPAQVARRARLREATAYAQRVYADPALKARYLAAAQKLGRNAFRLAVSDSLRGLRRDAPPAEPLLPVRAAFSSRRSLAEDGTPRSPTFPSVGCELARVPLPPVPPVDPTAGRVPPVVPPAGGAFSSRRSFGEGGTPRLPVSGNAAPPRSPPPSRARFLPRPARDLERFAFAHHPEPVERAGRKRRPALRNHPRAVLHSLLQLPAPKRPALPGGIARRPSAGFQSGNETARCQLTAEGKVRYPVRLVGKNPTDNTSMPNPKISAVAGKVFIALIPRHALEILFGRITLFGKRRCALQFSQSFWLSS